MKKNYFICLLLVLYIISCNKHKNHPQEDPIYTVSSAWQADTILYQEYVCQIRAIQHIELRALERGYLQKILVDEGQYVKKGQLLFQILPVIYQAEVEKNKAELQAAEIEYNNAKMLADSQVISLAELALAKAKLDKQKAELALAQSHLSFTEIRAPFDGYIGKFNEVRIGSLLEEGELLTTLSDNSKMWVYFNVPEAQYLDLVEKNELKNLPLVRLRMANNKIFEFPGKIETIEADFNNESGNIAFRATFPNPKNILRHGETGNIIIPVPVQKAIIIPQEATFEILDKKFVFVIKEDSTVESREIITQWELPHLYTVTKGLKPNEKILVEGLRKVKNGDKIRFKYKSVPEILSELHQLHAE